MKKHEVDDKFIMDEKEIKKERYKGKLFFIWFFVTICLIIYFSANEQGTLVACLLGHYCAIFGFIAFDATGGIHRFEESWAPMLFMVVGSIVMLLSLLCHFNIIEI